MSGRENRGNNQPLTNAMGKLKEKLSRSVDETPYDTLSASNTGTSLDTILPDEPFAYTPQVESSSSSSSRPQYSRVKKEDFDPPLSFKPIIEADDIYEPPKQAKASKSGKFPPPPTTQQAYKDRSLAKLPHEEFHRSKQSLKGSRVSFEKKEDTESEEDSFEDKRTGFQQQKTVSVDHKGILKDLRNILANDNRRQFQGKKHVSLDIKGTRFLKDLLKESSSEEDFHKNRREFQARKHQSLDPRVSFRLEKVLQGSSEDSEEEGDTVEKKRLIHRPKDITKPVIIDLKDFETESSSDEEYIIQRQNFQQQRSISTDSRKNIRFYEMDEIGSKKNENLRNYVPFVRQITEDGKPKLEVYRPTTNPIYIWTQVLAALSVSLGSLVVGFSSAYTSPALVSMTNPNVTAFEVSEQEASWVGGLMPLAALGGGIVGGPCIEYLGRRNTILAIAVPFIVAWLIIACAVNIGMVFAGRALAGFCVGIASLSLPVYLGETVQPEVRGTLGLLPTAFGNIGILICFVAGWFMDWSLLAFLGASLPIPFLVLMFLIPETPRWYVSRQQEDKARKALLWLRGKKADVEPELKGLMRSQADSDRQASVNTMRELLRRNNLKPLSISLGLMFFQQFSGINAVIFYTASIFKSAGSTIDENICSIIVGIVNFVATFVATMLIDRLGRKILLYISDAAMILTLITLGGFFWCKNNGVDISQVGWLPLASFVIYVLGFSLGFGPIPWLMMGEILPSKIRGSAASVATSFNWTCTFIVTKTFADLNELIGQSGTFWLFGAICCVSMFFVIFCVPETQGKTLEDIERKMMGRVRRMSSVANIKPLSFNM